MQKKDRLEHATHNEKTCYYLNKKPDYTDWVITTAFYTAVHFVRHKIFPLEIEIKGEKFTIDTFNKYCFMQSVEKYDKKEFVVNIDIQLNKHKLLSKLVASKCNKIANDYDKLRDLSHTARYNNYDYSREISDDCVKRMKRIKEFCNKNSN